MKRFMTLLLAMLMVLSLAACGDKSSATVDAEGLGKALTERVQFDSTMSAIDAGDYLELPEGSSAAAYMSDGSTMEEIFVVSCKDKTDASAVKIAMQELLDSHIGIIEERVIQHPRMMAMCPTSVNTIRIATLLGDKKQGIVYAFLRIGNGNVMDNVDQGGMAARVDLATGKLLTVGADKQGNTYTEHPITHTPIIGFEVPFFEEAKAMCLKAAQKVPQMRFVAWDVAVTEKGPVFIEGNSFPSHAVPQFAAHYPDGIGIMREFREFIDI